MVLIDEEVHLTAAGVDPVYFLFGSRYTNYLLGKLFWNGRIIPFFTDFFALIMWNVSAFLFGSVFFRRDHSPFVRFAALAYFSSVPFCVGEMFAFSQVILETSCGMAFTAVAFLLTVSVPEGKKTGKNGILNYFLAVVFLTLAFGSYQAFICVYATAAACCCLMRHWEKKPFIKELVTAAIICATAVMCYVLINHSITRVLASQVIANTTYLSDNYIGWKAGIIKAAFMALANVVRVSFAIPVRGVRIYGGAPICMLTLLFTALAVYRTATEKNHKERIKTVFLCLAVIMAPFCLYIALGTYKTPGRMMLALSVSGMAEILLLSAYVPSNGLRKGLAVLFTAAVISNAVCMNLIYFSAYRAYMADAEIADEIIEDIRCRTDKTDDKKIIFIGSHKREEDIKPVDATLGASFFEWDGGVNYRLRAFFELRGCMFNEAYVPDIDKGLSLSNGMEPWPAENSIRTADDLVIVYLNEPTAVWFAANLYR